MSGEGKDVDYKPKKKLDSTGVAEVRGPSRRQTRRVYYKEVEVLSSGGESEEAIVSESGFEGSVKTESEEPQLLPDTENIIVRKKGQVAMARESETSKLEKLMEMFLE